MGHITDPPPTPPQGRGGERLSHKAYKSYKSHKPYKTYKPPLSWGTVVADNTFVVWRCVQKSKLFARFALVFRNFASKLSTTSMSRIVIKDKTFETSISEAEMERVSEVASRINSDMAGKNPLLLAVLNGSFVFAADLVRRLTIPCEISFVKLASYEGTGSTGNVTELIGLNCDLEGRTVVVVEDIIDSGLTMERLLATLQKYNPESVHVCTLLLKPGNLQAKLDIEYVAIEIPNDFIVGYGLDYDQAGRGLRDIYTVVDN